MGHYTDCAFKFMLRRNTPPDVIHTLRCMVYGGEELDDGERFSQGTPLGAPNAIFLIGKGTVTPPPVGGTHGPVFREMHKKRIRDLDPLLADRNSNRWRFMLRCSAYHPDINKAELIETPEGYFLDVLCEFKNYEEERETFLIWLAPFLASDTRVRMCKWRSESAWRNLPGEFWHTANATDIEDWRETFSEPDRTTFTEEECNAPFT